MEVSWLDELVSTERLFGTQLITEVKSKLQTNESEQIMETLVKYKQEYLLLHQLWEDSYKINHPNLQERWNAEQEAALLIRYHTRQRDAFYRELLVLMRGEETVKKSERQTEQHFNEIYHELIEILIE